MKFLSQYLPLPNSPWWVMSRRQGICISFVFQFSQPKAVLISQPNIIWETKMHIREKEKFIKPNQIYKRNSIGNYYHRLFRAPLFVLSLAFSICTCEQRIFSFFFCQCTLVLEEKFNAVFSGKNWCFFSIISNQSWMEVRTRGNKSHKPLKTATTFSYSHRAFLQSN